VSALEFGGPLIKVDLPVNQHRTDVEIIYKDKGTAGLRSKVENRRLNAVSRHETSLESALIPSFAVHEYMSELFTRNNASSPAEQPNRLYY
jgi:hypothetical protein